MTLRGLDFSNYTGAPTAAWEALPRAGWAVGMPQAIDPPAGYPRGVTREQTQWCLDHMQYTVPYLWKWLALADNGHDDMQRRLDLLTPFAGQIDALVLDVEDTTVGVLSGVMQASQLPPEHVARLQRQPPPPGRADAMHAALGAGFGLDARIEDLIASLELLEQFPTKTGAVFVYTGPWYWRPYLGNTTTLADDGYGLLWANYDGQYDPMAGYQAFGGWGPGLVIGKQPQGTFTAESVGNVDGDVWRDDAFLVQMPAYDDNTGGDQGDTGDQTDPAWVAKKARVVAIAGELRTVADQLEAAADQPDQVRELAGGVRDRAGEILG